MKGTKEASRPHWVDTVDKEMTHSSKTSDWNQGFDDDLKILANGKKVSDALPYLNIILSLFYLILILSFLKLIFFFIQRQLVCLLFFVSFYHYLFVTWLLICHSVCLSVRLMTILYTLSLPSRIMLTLCTVSHCL